MTHGIVVAVRDGSFRSGHELHRRSAAFLAPAPRRHAGNSLEGAVEGGFRLVADIGRDAGDAVLAAAQAIGGALEAPAAAWRSECRLTGEALY